MEGEGVRSIARKVWIDAFPRLALTREEPLLRTFVRFRTLGQIFGRTNSGVPIKKNRVFR